MFPLIIIVESYDFLWEQKFTSRCSTIPLRQLAIEKMSEFMIVFLIKQTEEIKQIRQCLTHWSLKTMVDI